MSWPLKVFLAKGPAGEMRVMWQKRRSLIALLGLALWGVLHTTEGFSSVRDRVDGCLGLGHGRAESSSTWLGLVGGGGRPVELLEAFLRHASRQQQLSPRVLVVAWASGEPEESFGAIQSEFSKVADRIGMTPVFIPSLTVPRSKGDWENWSSDLRTAHGVWFTGGDQNRVLDALDSQVGERAKWLKSYCQGVAWGGTSAGTAIHGRWALTGEADLSRVAPDAVELREGTGFLPNIILDQHFLKRTRINRLLSALLKQWGATGLGIDEGTGWVLENGYLSRVMGESAVMLVQPCGSFQSVSWNVELLNPKSHAESNAVSH